MPQPQYAPTSDHQRASNMLGYALTLGDTDVWLGAVNVWRASLTDHELASLSLSVLLAQKPEHAAMTAVAALCRSGGPMPPLISAMDEAAFWADFAGIADIKACVLAGYNRLPGPDQQAFINYVRQGIAA